MQERILNESDLQPAKPLWHVDMRGQHGGHHGGPGRGGLNPWAQPHVPQVPCCPVLALICSWRLCSPAGAYVRQHRGLIVLQLMLCDPAQRRCL